MGIKNTLELRKIIAEGDKSNNYAVMYFTH